jgi:hypothetical protein
LDESSISGDVHIILKFEKVIANALIHVVDPQIKDASESRFEHE